MLFLCIFVLLFSISPLTEACKRKSEHYDWPETFSWEEMVNNIKAANAESITRAPDNVITQNVTLDGSQTNSSLVTDGESSPDELEDSDPLIIEEGELDVHGITSRWTDLLRHGPLAIAGLGELAVVSKKVRDFSLNEATPEGGFQHVKYPDSYKTTLIQISHSGHDAFMAAHHNMNRIRWRFRNIPDHLSTIERLTKSGKKVVIDKFLPIPLKFINETATSSKILAEQTASEFNKTQLLIEEVILAVSSLKGLKSHNLTELFSDRNETSKKQLDLQYQLDQLRRNARVLKIIDGFLKELGGKVHDGKFIALPDVSLIADVGGCSSKTQICVPKINATWSNPKYTDVHAARRAAQETKGTFQKIAQKFAELHKQNVEDVVASSVKLKESLDRIRKQNLTEVSLNETIEMLKEGLKVLGELKKHWTKVAQFFAEISILVERASYDLRYTNELHQELLNVTETEELRFLLDSVDLKLSLSKANETANLVHKFTQIYVGISSKYLVPQLNIVEKLLIVNIENKKLIQSEIKKLTTQVAKAMDYIGSIAEKETQSSYNSTMEMIDEIDGPDEFNPWSDDDELNEME